MLCSTLQMDIAGGVTNFRRRVLSFEVNILSDGWGNKSLVFHSSLILLKFLSPFPFSPSFPLPHSHPPSFPLSSHTSAPLPFLSLHCSLHPSCLLFLTFPTSLPRIPSHTRAHSPPSPYQLCEITVSGLAFLWHQVRCMVAILFLVGNQLEKPELIDHMLDIEACPRKPQYGMASG